MFASSLRLPSEESDIGITMLASIVYMIGCAFVAGILASVFIMLKPVKDRDDTKPWRTFILVYLFVIASPYAYIEVVTRSYGQSMEAALNKAYDATSFTGPMRYYRVMSCRKDTARCIIVGTDKTEWGGDDTPVMSVNMIKDGDKWKADSYKILTSGKLNQDSLVLPPFW